MQTQKPNIVTRTWYRLTDKEDAIHIKEALSKTTKRVETYKEFLRTREQVGKALAKLVTAPYNSPDGGSPFRIRTHWADVGFTSYFKRESRDAETRQQMSNLKDEINRIAPAWVVVSVNDWFFEVLPPYLHR